MSAAVVVLGLTVSAMAVTETEKQAAIDAGLAWLVSNQAGNGAWATGQGTDRDVAATAAALTAIAEEGYAVGDGTVYDTALQNGLSYLLSNASKVTLGDGTTGIRFVTGHHETYATGTAIPAIVTAGEKTMTANIGGTSYTYEEIVQKAANYFAHSQKKTDSIGGAPTGERGGWGYDYNANDRRSDNSNSQWPTLSLLYAESWGIHPIVSGANASATVKSELGLWINYIQGPQGSSYYDWYGNAGWGENMSRAGALLLEMAYAGFPSGTAAEQAAYNACINYINTNWQQGVLDYWNGHFGNPYTMWGIYKALEGTVGLADTATITNIRAQGSNVIDPGDTWNWYEDYSQFIVDRQAGTGAWPGGTYIPVALDTGWNISMLQATDIPIPPDPDGIPEPISGCLALMALLACGSAATRRRAH